MDGRLLARRMALWACAAAALAAALLTPLCAAGTSATSASAAAPSQPRAAADGGVLGGSGAAGGGAGGVTLLLQLTDLHFSIHETSTGDSHRAADVHALAASLLPRWPVAAAVISGDLTEAKEPDGRSQQHEREWQAYQAAWQALVAEGGVPPGQLYDTRGNHDTFDSGTRCGPRDFFCTYSARAAAGAGAAAGADAATDASNQQQQQQQQQQRQAAGARGARVFVDLVYDTRANGTGSCPAAVLVGVDASLEPGLRSPLNFLGVVQAPVLADLDRQLAATAEQLRSYGCPAVPYIAYGHYPLSTIAYPLAAGGGSVEQVLLRHGVSAYLCGHLHDAFGTRLHRLHAAAPPPPPPPPQQPHATALAGGAGAGDALTAAAAAQPPMGPAAAGAHLLELESVDWKYQRVLRLVTLDAAAGGAMGFADLRFRAPPPPPAAARAGAAAGGPATTTAADAHAAAPTLTPIDASRRVGAHLPLIASPPDARYAPQLGPAAAAAAAATTTATAAAAAGAPGGGAADARAHGASPRPPTAVVRVLVLPVAPGAPASPAAPVVLHWACGRVAPPPPPAPPPPSAPSAASGSRRRRSQEAGAQGGAQGAGAQGGGGGGGGPGSSELPPAWRPRGHGGAMGEAAAGGAGWGSVQMRLERAASTHSTYVADLLAPPPPAAAAAREHGGDAGAGAAAAPAAPPSPASCPPGVLTLQVVIGGDGGDGAAASTSELRPAHWLPPPQAAAPGGGGGGGAWAGAAAAGGWCDGGDAFVCAIAARPPPRPMNRTTLEWLVLRPHWYRFGLMVFALQWCALLAALLLCSPRVRRANAAAWRRCQRRLGWRPAPQRGGAPARGAPLEAAGAERAEHEADEDGGLSAPSCGAAGGAGAARGGAAKRSVSRSGSAGSSGSDGEGSQRLLAADAVAARAPFGASAASAASGAAAAAAACGGRGRGGGVGGAVSSALEPWNAALVAYVLYLGVGPWACGAVVSSERTAGGGSGGWGGLTAYGTFVWPLGGGWLPVFGPSLDFVVVANAVLLLSVVPATLLCAAAAARWRRLAAARCLPRGVQRSAPAPVPVLPWLLGVLVVLGLVAVAGLNYLLTWKVFTGLRWGAVVASPAAGWLLPLAGVWLWGARRAAVAAAAGWEARHDT